MRADASPDSSSGASPGTRSAAPIVEAIGANRLPDVAGQILARAGVRGDADEADVALARRAAATCTSIGERMAGEQRDVVRLLTSGGVSMESQPEPGPRQRHEIELRVGSAADAQRGADLLEAAGFRRWEAWSDGAAASFWRTASTVTLARTEDVTIVVRLRWADRPSSSRLHRAFRPTTADWALVDLPSFAWPAYHVIRPLRLVAERLRLRRRDPTGPGPFLSTPDQLIGPLLDLAEIGPSDTVLDFGCGDGRLVVAAAERGSRAIGVEGESAVAERARRRAAESGVGDRVRVVHGDAWRVDLRDVTAVFLFLPADLVPRVLRHALPRLPGGARVVAHEQSPIPDPPRPADVTRALITHDAVTVGHVWRVP